MLKEYFLCLLDDCNLKPVHHFPIETIPYCSIPANHCTQASQEQNTEQASGSWPVSVTALLTIEPHSR